MRYILFLINFLIPGASAGTSRIPGEELTLNHFEHMSPLGSMGMGYDDIMGSSQQVFIIKNNINPSYSLTLMDGYGSFCNKFEISKKDLEEALLHAYVSVDGSKVVSISDKSGSNNFSLFFDQSNSLRRIERYAGVEITYPQLAKDDSFYLYRHLMCPDLSLKSLDCASLKKCHRSYVETKLRIK